jgi:hypothetical protein
MEDGMKNINSEYHANKFNSESACPHCEGIFDHAAWCVTQHAEIGYAYRIVADASKITAGDSLILHSLGVAWADVQCKRVA